MITKFIRKRNINTALPFSKDFARVQVHSSGAHTFKFLKKQVTTPVTGNYLATEAGLRLTTEAGDRLLTE